MELPQTAHNGCVTWLYKTKLCINGAAFSIFLARKILHKFNYMYLEEETQPFFVNIFKFIEILDTLR